MCQLGTQEPPAELLLESLRGSCPAGFVQIRSEQSSSSCQGRPGACEAGGPVGGLLPNPATPLLGSGEPIEGARSAPTDAALGAQESEREPLGLLVERGGIRRRAARGGHEVSGQSLTTV
jgi:hypothetical protein